MPSQTPESPVLGHRQPKENGKKREPPKVVVVSEGRTELDYMDAIHHDNQEKFVYEPYYKEPFDKDLTDKNEMLCLLDALVRYMQGHITPYCYAT